MIRVRMGGESLWALVTHCKWKGQERIVSKCPLDEYRQSSRTGEKNKSQVDLLRLGFVAFEIKVKV